MTHSLHTARSVPWFSSFYWFFRMENSQASIFLCKQFGFTVLRWTIEIQLQLQRKQFNLKFKITLSTVRSFKVKRSTDIYSACEIISRNLLWSVVIVEKSVRKTELQCVDTAHRCIYIRSSYKIAVQSWQENFLVFHRMSASLYRPRLVYDFEMYNYYCNLLSLNRLGWLHKRIEWDHNWKLLVKTWWKSVHTPSSNNISHRLKSHRVRAFRCKLSLNKIRNI